MNCINKKIKILYLCVFVILILLICFLIFVFMKKNDTHFGNDSYDTWSYKKYETYDGNGKKINNSYEMAPFTLTFYDEKVDICYEKCFTNTYINDNDILTINDSDYFSGTFKVSYEKDEMVLKKDYGELGSFVYYFEKPSG